MILTLDQIDRLPAVRPLLDRIPDPRHRADHALRAYQGRHRDDLVQDLGLDLSPDEPVIIQAGCGTLTLGRTGNHLQTQAPMAAPIPVQANPHLVATRLATCSACDRFDGSICSVAGCRCTGLGDPDRRFGRCPLGRWDA